MQGGTGWLDTVQLQGENGDPLSADDVSISLSQGEIQEQADHYLALSQDAAGTVTLADGSELQFNGIERIEW